MEFRPATEADFQGEYEAFVAAQAELHDRHAVEWSAAPFKRFAAIQRHLLVHDGERSRPSEATIWYEDGEPVAYSYAAPGGAIGPVAGVDAARADCEVMAFVPGTAHELVLVAFAAGLRLSGPPGLLLLSRPESALDAFTISSYFLL